MEKRYQVFVSSTYEDLQKERQEVMHALLELDCMPSGMELFPATDEDQWTLIRKVIDDSDYYIVIVGGRYGSVASNGVSYTEMEYRYAMETGKPIIAFLHKDPSSLSVKRTEADPQLKEKLKEFINLCQKKVCKYWELPADLGSVVSRSLIMLMKNHPGVGWIKANTITNQESAAEILKLKKQIEELKQSLDSFATRPPEGSESLAQGEDSFELNFDFEAFNDNTYKYSEYKATFKPTWNDIFSSISPRLIDEASEHQLNLALNKYIEECNHESLQKKKQFIGITLRKYKVSATDFQTIKVQLRALGLIVKSSKVRSVKDIGTYWTLTPYGDTLMTKLRAIRKNGG